MSMVYVQTDDASLHVRQEHLEIRRADETLIESVRLREVDGVVIIGRGRLTTPALVALLDAGIDTAYVSAHGRFHGRLVSMESKNVFTRQAQFRRLDDLPFRLATAGRMVAAKIRHARLLAQRYARNHAEIAFTRELATLARLADSSGEQPSLDELRGLEGEAARRYFALFGRMLRVASMHITVRTRHPPLDPVNALLSFGYTLLTNEAVSAVAAIGLDPAVGVLHELHYSRPSLALDLVEEFRAAVDRLALRLINRRQLTPEHFVPHEPEGIYLSPAGTRIVLPAFHAMLTTPYCERASTECLTLRGLLARQAMRLKQAINGEADYQPMEWH